MIGNLNQAAGSVLALEHALSWHTWKEKQS
jgi:hypothetical protein